MKNKLSAIELSKDKTLMKEAFDRRGGVNHAKVFPLEDLPSITGKVVCKKRRGCKARDQFVIKLGDAFNFTAADASREAHLQWLSQLDPERYLVEEFLPCVKEYRVYVGRKRDGKFKAFHVDYKRPREGFEGADISNHATCEFVSTRDNKVSNYEVKRQAFRATKALGLNLAAVDIGLDEDGHAWVFETNTKPCIEREDVRVKWNEFREG